MVIELKVPLPVPLVDVKLADADSSIAWSPGQAISAHASEPRGASEHEDEKWKQWCEEQEVRWQEERAALERTLAGIAASIRSLHDAHRQRVQEMERAAVELAVTIASRLLHEKIQAEDFGVEEMVRRVVDQLETEQPVTVHLHPDDQALLERRMGGEPLFPGVEIRVVADHSLPRGDCRAEAGDVSVLSQLEEQLQQIHQHLLRSVGNERAES